MTPRQRDALAWVREVGEATPWQARKAGYQLRTLDALAHQGRVDATVVQGRVKPYTIYASHEHRQAVGPVDHDADHRGDVPDLMAALKASLEEVTQ